VGGNAGSVPEPCLISQEQKIGHWRVELNYIWELIDDDNPNLRLNDLNKPWHEWAKLGSDDAYARKNNEGPWAHKFQYRLYGEMKKNGELPPGLPGNNPKLPLAEAMLKAGVQ